MKLEKFSMGIGDRFGHQGKAQLSALIEAKKLGIEVVPVWNKSFREHGIIGTVPQDTRDRADDAVKALNYQGSYHVDADHINFGNVETFIECSDFFTLDVADFIAQEPDAAELAKFIAANKKYIGTLEIPSIDEKFEITKADIENIGQKFLAAVQHAGQIYRHLVEAKGQGNFITEVSMDESEDPQTPVEMFFILSAIAQQGIPAQTIAPKFTGRFNKGVEYVGDVAQFEKEFNQDIAVIAFAIKEFGLPENLKLSVHSGSDKFAIYEPISKAIKKFGTGLHLKTAGTTWLEELIGLAEAGGEGLEIAKKVYEKALAKFDELCLPYATVIDINKDNLPSVETVNGWNGKTYADTLRHDQSNPQYNLDFRQLLHVGYKIAAQMGDTYLDALKKYEDVVASNVAENILERHIKRIF